MTDPFTQSHEAARRKAIRDQSKAHGDALTKAAQERVKARESKLKESPNADIGYRMRPKFFEPGF